MEKLQSSLKNMMLSLVIICVVAAGLLAGVYTLTKETIDTQKKAKQENAILEVLPKGCTISEPREYNGMTVYEGRIDGKWVGTAVQVEEEGFGGPQKIMVGFDSNGKIINYVVLEHQETPGLGDKIDKWFKDETKEGQCIIGKKAGGFKVNKDGGDIDAITAATISSRAFLTAINKAYEAYTNGEVVATSASTQAEEQDKQEKEAENTQLEAQEGAPQAETDSIVNENAAEPEESTASEETK